MIDAGGGGPAEFMIGPPGCRRGWASAITLEEITEVLLQVGIYAGYPAALGLTVLESVATSIDLPERSPP